MRASLVGAGAVLAASLGVLASWGVASASSLEVDGGVIQHWELSADVQGVAVSDQAPEPERQMDPPSAPQADPIDPTTPGVPLLDPPPPGQDDAPPTPSSVAEGPATPVDDTTSDAPDDAAVTTEPPQP